MIYISKVESNLDAIALQIFDHYQNLTIEIISIPIISGLMADTVFILCPAGNAYVGP